MYGLDSRQRVRAASRQKFTEIAFRTATCCPKAAENVPFSDDPATEW
jgi:hypothetical protein